MRCLIIATLFAALVCSCLAAFPENTNTLIDNFGTCVEKTDSDIECISSAQEKLEKASEYIDDVEELKENIEDIRKGISTFKRLLQFAKYAPPLKAPAEALKRTLEKTVEPALKKGHDAVKKADEKLQKLQKPIDKAADACDTAVTALDYIQGICQSGKAFTARASKCVRALPGGSVKNKLSSKLEVTSDPLSTTLEESNKGFGHAGSTCAAITKAMDSLKNWPNLNPLKNPLNKLYNVLKPILKILEAVEKALTKKFCLKIVFKKFCFSVKSLLDGVKSVFKPLVKLAEKAIDSVLKHIPSFNIPGIPNFNSIINFNFSLKLPSIDFDVDVPSLNWRCIGGVYLTCAWNFPLRQC